MADGAQTVERSDAARPIAPPASTGRGWGSGGLSGEAAALRRRYPSYADVEAKARRRTPRFAYDFVAGGVADDLGVLRNRRALDEMEIVPRFGLDASQLDPRVDLFGRTYQMPVGVAPMGLAGLLWPDADESLAAAAQRAGIPYVMSTVANTTIERIAGLAPDVFWFQLYNVPGDDYAVAFDLIARAERAGAHVLVLTMDVPVRAKRVKDVRNGLVVPFRPSLKTAFDVARAPAWALAMLRSGQPRFRNFEPYLPPGASTGDIASFVYQKMAGALTWDAVARFRKAWPRALVVKGLLHPDDAERAASLGVDGIIVSNHGGRQFDAAPAPIDALPAIAARVGTKMTIMMDSSIRSGLDVVRALSRGAAATFAGRAFLYGHAALGAAGADHVARIFAEEIRIALVQTGAMRPAAFASQPDPTTMNV